MKNFSFLIIILMLSPALYAQQREFRQVGDFDEVIFAGRGDLILSKGSGHRMEIEADDGVNLENVITRVKEGTLHIEYMQDEDKLLDIYPRIRVYLTYRQLKSIGTEGIVNVSSEETIRSGYFSFQAEGMGDNVLTLDVENLEASIAGTANLKLSGRAYRKFLELNGTGLLDAFDLETRIAEAEVNGTGTVYLHATEKMVIDANGFGAKIRYRGNPAQKLINKSGWVSIKQDVNQ
jgi:hypothetical protein